MVSRLYRSMRRYTNLFTTHGNVFVLFHYDVMPSQLNRFQSYARTAVDKISATKKRVCYRALQVETVSALTCWFKEAIHGSDLVNVFRDSIRPLRFCQPGLDRLHPLAREVLQSEDVRPEADPVLVR